jgi:hypothetical protein
MRSTLAMVMILLGLPACGSVQTEAASTTATTTCLPGEQRACACAGGATGTQVCAADGKSLGACACAGAGGGTTSTSTTSTHAGGAGGATHAGGAGGAAAECATDVDCDPSDRCSGKTCHAGTCVAGPPPNPDDGNFCHTNACDPKTGAVTHTPKPGCECAHSLCDDGGGAGAAPLDPKMCTFGPGADCVAKVCLANAKCCVTKWDAECVKLATDGTTCAANPGAVSCACAHDFRCEGVALDGRCDPCVSFVCQAMPACCADPGPAGWSADCVAATRQLCNAPPTPPGACAP